MDLSPTHVHLLLNHFPTIGFIIGLGLFLGSLVWKLEEVKRASLIIFVGIAIISIPTYATGNAAQERICGSIDVEGPCSDADVSRHLIERHESAALGALALMALTGGTAWIALWKARTTSRISGATSGAVLVLALLSLGVVSRAANLGGEIRHPEIRVTQDTNERPLGRLIGDMVRDTPWIWIACETLHFVGLTMLVGVVLLIDLRVLGVMTSVPFRALDRMLLWAILGFGLNTLTGMLFFIASPYQYISDSAFYWKLAFLVLAPANTLYFTFDRGWMAGVDRGVPKLTKALAMSALVCWVGVMFWGSMLPFLGSAF